MKILMLVLNEQEERAIEKITTALSDFVQFEDIRNIPVSVLSFPGLEIRQHQRRVLQGGADVSLTRLEYSTLVLLASNPGIVLTRTQIFEAVWNMDSLFNISPMSILPPAYTIPKFFHPKWEISPS